MGRVVVVWECRTACGRGVGHVRTDGAVHALTGSAIVRVFIATLEKSCFKSLNIYTSHVCLQYSHLTVVAFFCPTSQEVAALVKGIFIAHLISTKWVIGGGCVFNQCAIGLTIFLFSPPAMVLCCPTTGECPQQDVSPLAQIRQSVYRECI